jgi:hypothetical protein
MGSTDERRFAAVVTTDNDIDIIQINETRVLKLFQLVMRAGC